MRSAVFAMLVAACAIAACGKHEPASVPAPPPAAKQAPPSTPPPPPADKPAEAKPPAPPPAPAAAAPPPIGTIDSLEGEVRLTRAGTARAAQAGMALEPGDALQTGVQSWALLAMADGASVTIRPATRMKIDAYRYAPDGPPAENTATWSLVKGALRSITGLVGKRNPAGYSVVTPTATIGIRGTDHEPAYYPPPAPGERAEHPPGTYDKVNSGESVIRSPRGNVPVRRGQTAFANADAKAKPQILARPPAFYQRQAEVDRRVVLRREQFHRQYDQEQQKRAEQQKKAEARKSDQQRKADERKAEPRRAPEKKAAEKKADDRKARQADKASLPPGVADRIRNMQRGDKATPAEPGRREAQPAQKSQQTGPQRAQQPAQPRSAQPERPSAQRQQAQQRPQREGQPQRPQPQREAQQPQRPQPQRPEARQNERQQRKGEEGKR
ncbi:MAG TPA: FecR domain-containing protein [Burkholderiales bacterium]|nr:FecR domain-containing protein [Burkholderiales bacterium]